MCEPLTRCAQQSPTRKVLDMDNDHTIKLVPTFSMQPVRYDADHYGVRLEVTGLASLEQANKAMDYMQRLFCGAEISTN